MKPLNPNDTLILETLSAAALAQELGFVVESYNSKKTHHDNFGDLVGNPQPDWENFLTSHEISCEYRLGRLVERWRIIVTESGPNAAENFLPRLGDFVSEKDGRPFPIDIIDFLPERGDVPMFYDADGDHIWLDDIERIIERDGKAFPRYKIKETL